MGIAYHRRTFIFIFVVLKRNTLDIKHHVGEDHSNSFPPYCWYFLMFTDKIHKRTEDTVVALHPESIQGIVISQGTEVYLSSSWNNPREREVGELQVVCFI